jgi:hypothetical protein
MVSSLGCRSADPWYCAKRLSIIVSVSRAVILAAAALLVSGATSAAGRPAAAARNPIQIENARTGTTAWQVKRATSADVYAGEITALPGAAVDVHVSTAARYRVDVYRLGWYRGAGARLLACVPGCKSDEQGHVQPAPSPGPPVRAGWPTTDVVHTGRGWVTGYYLIEALLTSGPDAGKAATTFVILRAPESAPPTPILVQVPVNTWEAYNQWGGPSLYDMDGISRAHAVSFDRPFGANAQSPMWWEIQLVRFLEREGYDVSYQTDLDTDSDETSLLRHQLVIVAGHDEYWTMGMRRAFDRAQARGTNLAFMGANDAYWHVDYQDGDRTIFSYKSMYDPNPVVSQKTAMFREIGLPECELMGVQQVWITTLDHTLDYTVTAAGAADPWLAGTGLHAGDTIAGVVGREHDQINPYPQACFKPGLVDLFHYDGGTVDQNGDAVRWTAPSGARVFASGAQEFSWALDGWRTDGSLFTQVPVGSDRSAPVDPRVQRFMRNVLADLVRPAQPTGLTFRLAVGSAHVRVARPIDPRVTGFNAAYRFGSGPWHRLCSGRIGCTGRVRLGTGQFEVGAVAINRWDIGSAAQFAVGKR